MTGDPLPRRMERLPRDVAGRPVPWFVAWVDGKPDFRLVDSPKLAEALRFRRCWVCGEMLGAVASFPLGPMCVVNRTVSEPGSHLDCAEWSARNCPFLANPDRDRRTNNLPDDVSAPAGDMLLRNPGAVAVYSTRRWKVERHPGGVLLALGEPTSVSWWAEGRPATRAEVEASIRSGLPFLEAACDREPEARRERAHRVLRDQAESAAALLPDREEP